MLCGQFWVSLSECHNMNNWKLVLAAPAGNRIWIRLLFLD